MIASPGGYEQYSDWERAIKKSCDQSSNWKYIDDWCYSTLTNKFRGAQKLYHLCYGSHKIYLQTPHPDNGEQISLMENEHCVACGDVIPEGLKMIVMLLESGI